MKYSEILNREFERSGSNVKIRDVPKEKKPTAESLKLLEREIASQISANDAMRCRSMNKIR